MLSSKLMNKAPPPLGGEGFKHLFWIQTYDWSSWENRSFIFLMVSGVQQLRRGTHPYLT